MVCRKGTELNINGKDLVGDLWSLVQVDNFTGGMYTGSFDLGYVKNIALFPNETTTEDSTIAFDVILGFMNGASVEDGQVANMTFAIIASDGAPTPTEDQAEIPFTVTAVNLTEFNITSKFTFTCPGSAYVLPGAITSCFLTMNFTDNKEFVIFDVEASPNTTDSVGMTIHSFRVIDIGANLMTNGEPTYSYEYVLNNAQLNRLSVDFGVITNNRTSSDPADNQLEMEIKVQATDTAENENGTELVLGTGASISDKLIWVSFTTFNIERTGSEIPQLDYNFTVVDSGDMVTYDVIIQHELGVSSAEVSALTLTIFQPPYFVYESSSSDIVFTATDSGNSLVLSIPELLFTDAISISVVYSRDCTYMFTFKEKWKATSLLQIQYQTHNRDINGVVDSGTPLGNVMKEPLQIVTFDFNVSQLISNAWTVGKSGPYADQRWLKIDIGRLTVVTMIQTQGGIEASVEGDIGEYEVFYSRDDIVYKRGYHMNDSTLSEIFDHRRTYPDPVPADYYDIHTTYFLARPVEARYVLIRLGADNVGDDRVYNALRVELYGCFIEAPETDICPIEKTFTGLPEEYDRGFVVNTNTDTLYVCNVMVNDGEVGLVQGILDKDTFLLKRGKRRTRCFKTQDTYAWQSLDDHIRNVIGYSPSTGGVYAIAGYTSPAYMVSYDEGLQWVEISIDDFTDASSAIDYISYKELPTESTDGFNFVNSSYVYQSHGNWEASFDGMFGLRLGSPEKILDWNTCCKT
ncbi:hypothetical protein BSL78_21467 [Apostichopus japonicus]|uniref:F5/8 type C domain-containing protein n=1 Tax=Stichopus japonicus TaxID=307972 RepID=A0A2G8K146_STIJA|nr:hypothetical protein BSL78_21467 [Apostichopus japonicus]